MFCRLLKDSSEEMYTRNPQNIGVGFMRHDVWVEVGLGRGVQGLANFGVAAFCFLTCCIEGLGFRVWGLGFIRVYKGFIRVYKGL